jgi:phosphoribosylanthranilate isomerase
MHKAPAIKICRIQDLETAELALRCGAQYIGLHAINRLNPEKEQIYREISRQIRNRFADAGVVLLTYVSDVNVIIDMVSSVNPTHIQLYSRWTAKRLGLLKEQLIRSDYPSVEIILAVDPADTAFDRYCADLHRSIDFFLLDNFPGGTGSLIHAERLRDLPNRLHGVRYFIAGGLNAENVRRVIDVTSPYGVDVQTGVELPGTGGRKDPMRMKQFIEAVGPGQIPRGNV